MFDSLIARNGEVVECWKTSDNLAHQQDQPVKCWRNIRQIVSLAPHLKQDSIEKGAALLAKTKDAAPSICRSVTYRRESDDHIRMVRKQRDVCRADGFLTDSLEAFLVQVHLAAVFVDNVLRQYRRAITHEVGLEVVEDDVIVVFDEAVDDTVDQQIVR